MFDIIHFDNQSNTLGARKINIREIERIKEYLFIILDNGQKFLTNGSEIYDVSEYDYITNVFTMGNILCAIGDKYFITCVFDLDTKEVLFEDKNAYFVDKNDERTLHVILKSDDKNIYDIETKRYLPKPHGYEYEESLGNSLYVFSEKCDSGKKFYERKRCVINADLETLLKDIEGYIYFTNNYLFICNETKINIVGINEKTLEMKTIIQNENTILGPIYYDGNIIIIEKENIKIYNPNLKLIKVIKVDKLSEIIDSQLVGDILKLCLPLTVNGKQINKQLHVNLKTGKIISHVHIEGYPYWIPTTHIGIDELEEKTRDYYFYNCDFELITNILCDSYVCVDTDKECMFLTEKGEAEKKEFKFINTLKGYVKDVEYEFIKFHPDLPYGYGINFLDDTMDFFDEDLNIIIPKFDYKKFGLENDISSFGFFIVNNYICITKHFTDCYGHSKYRRIIQKSTGEIILDSTEHKCYMVGDLIQMIGPNGTQFLNTITGNIGNLSLTAPVGEDRRINFKEVNDINNILIVGNDVQLLDDKAKEKVKK